MQKHVRTVLLTATVFGAACAHKPAAESAPPAAAAITTTTTTTPPPPPPAPAAPETPVGMEAPPPQPPPPIAAVALPPAPECTAAADCAHKGKPAKGKVWACSSGGACVAENAAATKRTAARKK